MNIKKAMMIGVLGCSVLTSSVVSAMPNGETHCGTKWEHSHHQRCHSTKHDLHLTLEQRKEFHILIKAYRDQAAPLMKQQRALNLQLNGKLATPGIQLENLTELMSNINKNHAKLVVLRTTAQLSIYQKLGVLPSRKFH